MLLMSPVVKRHDVSPSRLFYAPLALALSSTPSRSPLHFHQAHYIVAWNLNIFDHGIFVTVRSFRRSDPRRFVYFGKTSASSREQEKPRTTFYDREFLSNHSVHLQGIGEPFHGVLKCRDCMNDILQRIIFEFQ